MLHRPDDLAVKLVDDIGDVAASDVEPGQMDQNGSDHHRQQYEPGQRHPQPELTGRSNLPRGRPGRRVGRLPPGVGA